MIYITKNTTNNIVLELTQTTTLITPNYLFELINESNIDAPKRYFTTPDVSLYINRYNEFIFVDADNGSDTDGNDIPMNWNFSQYQYNIYVSSAVIDINDVSSIIATEPISTGRMIVTGIDNTVDPVYDNNIPDETDNDVYA